MRELKFRIFRDGTMHDPFDLRELHSHGISDGVVMQFTGLKDKNGVEVYEGDILKYDLYHDYGQTGEYKSYREEVRYVTGCAAFTPFHRYTSYEFSHDRMEVIGNIYENPALLEAK